MAIQHQKQVEPLHKLIIIFMFILSLLCIAGGIFAVFWNSTADTNFSLLGASLSTRHVGVAFMGISILTAFLTMKSVLKNQKELAALPKE
jgi:membrane protein implicated in regulation of membrane protease activity